MYTPVRFLGRSLVLRVDAFSQACTLVEFLRSRGPGMAAVLRHIDPCRPIQHLKPAARATKTIASIHFNSKTRQRQGPNHNAITPNASPCQKAVWARVPKASPRLETFCPEESETPCCVSTKPSEPFSNSLNSTPCCEGSETLATSCKHKFGHVLSRPMIEMPGCCWYCF